VLPLSRPPSGGGGATGCRATGCQTGDRVSDRVSRFSLLARSARSCGGGMARRLRVQLRARLARLGGTPDPRCGPPRLCLIITPMLCRVGLCSLCRSEGRPCHLPLKIWCQIAENLIYEYMHQKTSRSCRRERGLSTPTMPAFPSVCSHSPSLQPFSQGLPSGMVNRQDMHLVLVDR
jgi:hypothetical protein